MTFNTGLFHGVTFTKKLTLDWTTSLITWKIQCGAVAYSLKCQTLLLGSYFGHFEVDFVFYIIIHADARLHGDGGQNILKSQKRSLNQGWEKQFSG